jgi:vitamin B12 transporter
MRAGVRRGDVLNNHKNHLAAWLFAASFADPVLAEEIETYDLQPNLVVTPARQVETIDQSFAAVSVLTREDIERSAAQDIHELLRLLPGVDLVRSGGPGGQVSVFIRGSNSNHVLVLIDGVRAASSNTGAYAWEQIPLNQVERVEVVRGPRASVYGSDAIGGVIQIFTRGQTTPYARVTAGSYDSVSAEGGIGYEGVNSRISLNAGYRDVGGFSAQNENGFSYDPDDDGFETANLGIKGAATTGSYRWTYSLLALESETEFDQGVSDASQSFGALGFEGRLSGAWAYQLLAGFVTEDLESDFGFYTTGFESERLQFSWQNQYRAGTDDSFNFGVDWYRENGSSQAAWDESRNNFGLFAIWNHRAGRLGTQVSGRWDDNSLFGGRFTGQAAIDWAIGDTLTLFGSLGSGFRGPNLNEQYSPGFGGLFAGNPELDPESSLSGELGLRWRPQPSSALSVYAYQTRVDDLIAFYGRDFQAVNVDEAELEGIEAEYRWSLPHWDLAANLTLQRTEDLATGEPLLRRPDEKAAITVDRRFGNGSWLGLEWVYSGERSDFGGIRLDSYHLLNLRAGWQFRPAWQLGLRGDNLADEVYEPAFGFNAAGRSWYLSLAWMP